MAVAGEIVIELRVDNGQMRMAVKDSGTVLRQFDTTLQQTARSVKRLEDAQHSLSTKFRHLVMTLGNLRFVAMDVNDIFLRLPAAIMRNAGELERLQTLMKGLSTELTELGRVADGQRSFNFVTGLAKNAPFEISALSDAFVKLKTTGIDPTKGAMTALTDSVARFGGTGEILKRASIAIQQMAGKGVISMEELRQQLGEAVPTAMRSMAEGMGISMAELAKVVSTGTLQAQAPLAKMLARMRVENDGAAEAMMETWVGKMSQLKTEWMLASKMIADSGFGDSAKEAVDLLKAGLQSKEFRQFAIDFGQSLATAIKGIASVVRFVVEYRDAIISLTQAWVAYKVFSSGLLPTWKALREGVIGVQRGIIETKNAQQGALITERNVAAEKIQLANEATAAQMRSSQANIASMQKELAFRQAMAAQMRLQMEQMYAPLAAGKKVRGADGRFISAESVRAQIRDISRLEAAHTAANAKLAENLTQQRTLHAQAATQVLAHGNQVDKLTGATRAYSAAAWTAAAASRAGGFVWTLLGGWAGVAIIAIMAVASAWYKLAAAAREAKAAQKREEKNQSTEDDLEVQRKSLEDLTRRRDALKAQVEGMKNAGVKGAGAEALLAKKVAALQTLEAEVTATQLSVQKRAAAVERTLASDYADSVGSNVQVELNAMKAAARDRMQAEKAISAERLKGLTEGTKEYQKVSNENVKRESDTFIELRKQQAEKLEKAAKDFDNRANGRVANSSEREGLKQAAENARQEAQQIRDIIKTDLDAAAMLVQLNSDPKKGPGTTKESPLQQALDRLKVDKAGFDQEIEDIQGALGKVDLVNKQVARFTALIEAGELDPKDTKADSPQYKGLFEAIRATFGSKDQRDELKKDLKASEDVTEMAERLGLRFGEAIEILNDPLGTNKSGPEERALDKLIIKLGDRLPAALKVAGVSLDELRAKSVTADVAGPLVKLAEETQRLESEITGGTRLQAMERQRIEDETHRRRMQNLIDRMKAEGVAADQIQAAQSLADRNAAARGAKSVEDFKTPMQKLLDEWAKTTDQMDKLSAKWTNATADHLTEMVMGGKASFSDLARSIIADLVRIQIQKAILGMVNAATGFSFFANGGIMSSAGSLPLKTYAKGGIANSPQMAIFGEGSMNEAYVPLPDGRTIPVTLTGGGGGTMIQINVYKDGQTDTSGGGEPGMVKLADRIRGVVRDEMMNQKRPGGLLA